MFFAVIGFFVLIAGAIVNAFTGNVSIMWVGGGLIGVDIVMELSNLNNRYKAVLQYLDAFADKFIKHKKPEAEGP